VGIVVFLVVGTSTVAVTAVRHSIRSRYEGYFQSAKFGMTSAEVETASAALDAAPKVVLLRPTHYAGQGDYVISGSDTGPGARVMRRGCTIQEVLLTAYGVGAQQMVLPAKLPQGLFDLLLTVPNPQQALQAELKKQFGWVARTEYRDADVLVMNCVDPSAPGLKSSVNTGALQWLSRGNFKFQGYKMSGPGNDNIAYQLGVIYNRPVVDETGLTSLYDLNLSWEVSGNGRKDLENFQRSLREQAGLTLVPARRQVEMLVVESVK
jgi:uncharacterized protein (TIGR03435 family)